MWLSNTDIERLKCFEKRIRRKIYESKTVHEKEYRRLLNHEITETLGGKDIVKIVKSQRIRWYGYMNRKDDKFFVEKK